MRTIEERAVHQQQIDYVRKSGITVEVVPIYGTVAIETKEGTLAFLQGDEGSSFVTEARHLWNKWEDITMSEVYELLAYPYADLEVTP